MTRIGMAADRQVAGGLSGARDATDVLLGEGRVRASTVRRESARSEVAANLSSVGAAVEQGLLGGDHLDSFAQAAKGLTDEEQQLLNTDELVGAAVSLPADVFDRRIKREADRIKADHGLGETKAKQAASWWRHWFDESTGMGRIAAGFDPERYESIVNTVEQHLARLANKGDVTKSDNLAATAAYELLTSDGRQPGQDGRGKHPHLTVIVDHRTMASGLHDRSVRETGDGHVLPPESISRLACDATMQRVTLDDRGVPIDVGRRYRTATDAQWQVIRAIYATCAWQGCDRPLRWCQLHHIHEWEDGGETDLCNLIPLCNRHHHAVHEGGWTVKLRADRRLDIVRPGGTHTATTRPDRQPTQPQGP
jgi:hypothetical protein